MKAVDDKRAAFQKDLTRLRGVIMDARASQRVRGDNELIDGLDSARNIVEESRRAWGSGNTRLALELALDAFEEAEGLLHEAGAPTKAINLVQQSMDRWGKELQSLEYE